MRILISSLGFAYHHVMAAANRCSPDKILLATVNPEADRVKNAVEEVRIYGRRLGVEVSVVKLNPEEFWSCVQEATGFFTQNATYFLDVGGGVRALSLCLLTAALLAITFLDARIERVYTMAEHSERIVEADIRPVLYAKRLADSRAFSKRELLTKLASGGADWGRYGRLLLREFAQYGLADDNGLTEAGRALAKIIELSTAKSTAST
ncbi:hypothetical protein [Pyrobaculum aerophilum]|uniref:Csa3 N-terminal domain-containing protein n=2 Tax=Pyrobaculum aerophilum TaxID=13773 RepID=Q8ZZU5_PYRAE|nr:MULTISPECIES: hypothetical protein [Pyrobaculum]AAL62544.1 hypothetical protein PAE0077 [Pyrobaculum aerophilum str. IM2]MCX8136623.1 hypothetical protein [Pyrobaculum aerophilum]